MSTQNHSEMTSTRRTSSTLIALSATLFLLVAPNAMARPADSTPAFDTATVVQWIQDLFGDLGRAFAKSTTEGETEPTPTPAAPSVQAIEGDLPVTEGSPVLEPVG